MAKMYYESDADMSYIENKQIAIVGYGSQGHAHALNLKDSGLNVSVGLYDGRKSWKTAEDDGLSVGTVSDVSAESDIIMMLIPDHLQSQVYENVDFYYVFLFGDVLGGFFGSGSSGGFPGGFLAPEPPPLNGGGY